MTSTNPALWKPASGKWLSFIIDHLSISRHKLIESQISHMSHVNHMNHMYVICIICIALVRGPPMESHTQLPTTLRLSRFPSFSLGLIMGWNHARCLLSPSPITILKEPSGCNGSGFQWGGTWLSSFKSSNSLVRQVRKWVFSAGFWSLLDTKSCQVKAKSVGV